MKKRILLLLFYCMLIQSDNLLNRELAMKSYYQNRSVLVTGGCGFIGSHLVETLVSYGANVTVLDDLSTGSLDNIASCMQYIRFIKGSVDDLLTCKNAVEGTSHVFHLAAFISVPQSIEDPLACHRINVDGTFNMLEASRHSNVQRFLFSSSSAVYGLQEGACSEDMPCKPASPYGFSKLIGEQLCLQFAQHFGIETVILRYFNVFGERQNPGGAYAAVVAKFNDLMMKNEPIAIFGDGRQTRDFISVQQIVHANLFMGMIPASVLKNRVYNVATGKSITIIELFHRLKEAYPGYQHNPTFLPARAGDIATSSADCSALFKLYKDF